MWRVKKIARLHGEQRLPDGSYLSRIYRCERDRRNKRNGIKVRVIDYHLKDVPEAEPIYRLITTIYDGDRAPAGKRRPLSRALGNRDRPRRNEDPSARSAKSSCRSSTPELVRQEFYGLLMAHFAIRGLMHEAALKADEDPDRLSFLHAVRVIRRKPPRFAAIPP